MTAVIIMAAVFFTTIWLLNRGDRAIQGLSIGSVSVNKLNENDALERVKGVSENYLVSELILKTPDGLEIKTSPRDIGIQLDIDASVEKAFSRGREGSLPKKLYEQTRALFIGLKEPMTAEIDDIRFNEFIKFSLADVHKPAQNATFEYSTETEEFEFVPAKVGIVVDKSNLRQKIFNSGQTLSLGQISLIQNTDKPRVAEESSTNEAKLRAQEVLNSMPYTIKAQSEEWKVEKEDIVSWISFVPSEKEEGYELSAQISQEAIENYLSPFAPGLQKNPVNAAFEIKNNRVQAFSLSESGAQLNIADSAQAVKDAVENDKEEAILVFDEIKPEITEDGVDNLGINSLLGKGESDFSGSPKNRVHNITVGAKKYHGALIAPGEEFSFNELLGPVNASTGYLPELVIKQNVTIPEYGGGLCQVSTTLFRAAVYSGLKITARSNHAYPVRYYGTPGFDATIYPPNPDLRFVNNTPGHILIQTQMVGVNLIFEIYGQDDGRTTEIDGPHTYDAQASGAIKAWVKQTVYDKNDNVMLEKTFYSNYRSPSLYPVNRNPLE